MDTHKYIITAHSAAAAAAAADAPPRSPAFRAEEWTRARLVRINGTGFGGIGDEIATRARGNREIE